MKANGVDLEVVSKAYGWTVDDDWYIYALVAGDHGYEETGIRLDHPTREALDGHALEKGLVNLLRAFDEAYGNGCRGAAKYDELIKLAKASPYWDRRQDPLAENLESKFGPDPSTVCTLCMEAYPQTGQRTGPAFGKWGRGFRICRRCISAGKDARRRG